MGMMDPVFRERNYARIRKLREKNLSDSTIAGILSDETGIDFDASDVSGYLKINGVSSKQMLVSKVTLEAIVEDDDSPVVAPV